MEDHEFDVGDMVRMVNETQSWEVLSLTFDGTSCFYDVENYSGNIVHRVAECALVRVE